MSVAADVRVHDGRVKRFDRLRAGLGERGSAYRRRPVSLTSPHSPEECARRLAAVTSERGQSWYLSPHNAVRPDPRLRGHIAPAEVHLAGFADSLNARYHFPVWLEARMVPAAGGGTTLTGTVGPEPGEVLARRVFLGAWLTLAGLFGLGWFIAGLVLLSHGRLAAALPPLLIPLAAAAALLGYCFKTGWRSHSGEGLEPAAIALVELVGRLIDAPAAGSIPAA